MTLNWHNLGLIGGGVRLAEYDPQWPEIFERERTRILEAVGEDFPIEHIGSTSVPGLAAKPVLDIMPGFIDEQQAARIIKPMQSLGYIYRGEFGIPNRYFFIYREGERSLVNCHAFLTTDIGWRRHLFFRDYLCQHPEKREEYEALKRRLAQQYQDDRAAYTDAKSEFIQGIEGLDPSPEK